MSLIYIKPYYWFLHKISRVPEPDIPGEEVVSRYLFSKNSFSKEKKRVKYTAFMPSKKENDLGEFSVYRTTRCSSNEKKSFAKLIRKDKDVKALANLRVEDIVAIQNKGSNKYLRVQAYSYPHPKHANIKGIRNSSKPLKMNLAQRLSEIATLELAEDV